MGRNTYKPHSAKLPELVKSRFSNAKANGDINFYPTQVAVLKPGSIPVRPTAYSFYLPSQSHRLLVRATRTNNNE